MGQDRVRGKHLPGEFLRRVALQVGVVHGIHVVRQNLVERFQWPFMPGGDLVVRLVVLVQGPVPFQVLHLRHVRHVQFPQLRKIHVLQGHPVVLHVHACLPILYSSSKGSATPPPAQSASPSPWPHSPLDTSAVSSPTLHSQCLHVSRPATRTPPTTSSKPSRFEGRAKA